MRLSRHSTPEFLEYWSPVFVWLTAIYIFSTDSFSSDGSSKFVVPLLTFFFPGITPGELDLSHAVIRKFGHITEYFILALLVYRALKLDEPNSLRAKRVAALLILMTAITDEFHQTLTLSRVGSLGDIGYDCLGGLLALGMKR